MAFSKTSILAVAAGVALAVQHGFIWLATPEAQSGPVQKIFYLHLPIAWWALVSFLVVFGASLAYLLRRGSSMDALAGAAAELGVLFTSLVLMTGSLWARKEWGHWWVWDPKLTTALIMWYVYSGYLVLRSSPLGRERRALVCAVVGVVAFLDVPLVFFATKLWGGVHPADTAQHVSGMAPAMWRTILVGLVGMGFLWSTLLVLRLRQRLAEGRLEALLTGGGLLNENADPPSEEIPGDAPEGR